MSKGRRTDLPILHQIRQVRREMEKQMSSRDGDLMTVGLDDPIPFSCARTGNCCTGRQLIANFLSPTELRLIYEGLREDGLVRHVYHLFRDNWIARVIQAPPSNRTNIRSANPSFLQGGERVNADDYAFHPEAVFLGFAFNMKPDPDMQDGDRCVFLIGTRQTGLSCRWHGTRAQPVQCAIAPLAVEPTFSLMENSRFFYPRSRLKWCEGMRKAKAGLLPSTTPREILSKNDGWARLQEYEKIFEARRARSSWTPSEADPHSPLARLYIAELPDLAYHLRGL